jgi:molybdopterin molybdotransferase
MTLLGLDSRLPTTSARLAKPLPENDEREDYLRAFRAPGEGAGLWLEAATRQDSSMAATMTAADALLIRAPYAPAADVGAPVQAILLAEAESILNVAPGGPTETPGTQALG